ncbi:MAG: peptide chain release factor 2, partial [Pseudomonadota bacterium]
MRAETQAIVADIEKSLGLLRQRIGWDTAEARLEEYNAFAEDPNLWNDPTKAQKLMRERQKLSDSIDTATGIARE